jgi:hypothetical protein
MSRDWTRLPWAPVCRYQTERARFIGCKIHVLSVVRLLVINFWCNTANEFSLLSTH